jgi:CO/xanthine dehydrogenase FAD-binding subunit
MPSWSSRRVAARDACPSGVRGRQPATTRAPDELVTGLFIPGPLAGTDGAIGRSRSSASRAYLVISIAMVAAVVEVERADGSRGRASPSGPAPRSRSGSGARGGAAGLAGRRPDGRRLVRASTSPASPIDDVRGTGAYRREAALELVRRALAAGAGVTRRP